MTPSQLAALILSRLRHDEPPRSVEDRLYIILTQEVNPSQAVEMAEKLSPSVTRALKSVYELAVKRGSEPPFRFNSSSPSYIQGVYFSEPRDPEDVRAAKLARAKQGDILSAVQRLSFDDFEVICAKVLEDLGATRVVRTSHAADQGIDFYGRLVLGQLAPAFPLLRLEDSITIWLLGQAKHYPTYTVQPSEMRELAGSILLARHREFTVQDIYPDMQLRSCDPVIGLFITSGHFSRGSLRIAGETGIICKDGIQLAAFLADHGRGLSEQDGIVAFSQEAFDLWLGYRTNT